MSFTLNIRTTRTRNTTICTADVACGPPKSLILALFALQYFFTVVLVSAAVAGYLSRGPESRLFPIALPSPAEDAVSYYVHRFHSTINGTVYQGSPNSELDAAWEELYEPGSTTPNDPTNLSIFHSLRCLNTVRQAFYPDYYNLPESSAAHGSGWTPIDECIDFVRQSLMCMADVSTLIYVWDENFKRNLPSFESVHTCRDFERVHEWARTYHVD